MPYYFMAIIDHKFRHTWGSKLTVIMYSREVPHQGANYRLRLEARHNSARLPSNFDSRFRTTRR